MTVKPLAADRPGPAATRARKLRRADTDLLQVCHLMQAGIRPERVDHLSSDVSEHLGRLIDQWLSADAGRP